MTEKEALALFDEYLNGISYLADGNPVIRKHDWSISRIAFARNVWMNARGFWL